MSKNRFCIIHHNELGHRYCAVHLDVNCLNYVYDVHSELNIPEIDINNELANFPEKNALI